jgi:hypothetical protein
MHLAKLARDFFTNRTPVKPTEIVMQWDTITIKRMKAFGERASHEAQVMATQCLLRGETKEANEIAQDVTAIQKNLKAVDFALKMVENYKFN